MKKRTSKEIFAETLLELSTQYPVDKITVKQIVEESGLSLQTFYNHFKDKYDLIFWIHRSEGDRMMAKLDTEGYGYDDLVMENIRFFLEHKDYMRNVFSNTHGENSYAELAADNAYRVWKERIVTLHGEKAFTEEIAFYLKMFCFSAVKMMAEWCFHMEGISPEQFAEYMREGMPDKLKPFLLDD